MKQYLNGSDVRMKLNRTVVFYKGLPYIANSNPDDGEKWEYLLLQPIGGKGKTYEILHYDENLVTAAPELGYINIRGSAHYMTRLPSRVQNQGLRSENITTVSRVLGSGFFSSGEFADALLGKYPKLKTAEDMLQSLAWDKVAIHKQFAIGIKADLNIGLYYQDKLIGYKDTNGKYIVDKTKNSSFIIRLINKTGVFDADSIS